MGSNIGSAALVLTTESSGLTSGLDKAASEAKSKISAMAASVKGHLGGLTDSAKSSMSQLGGFIKGGIAGLAAGFGAGAFSGAISGIKELASAGKQAKSLGIASDQFMGLSEQMSKFGIEGEDVTKILGKMSVKVLEAAKGGDDKLFRGLGLSAKELAALPIDQQFTRIADAVSKLGSPAEQAAAAMGIFEKKGIAILPMLQKGGKSIGDTTEEFKKMGLALGQSDMDKLLKAQQALPKLGQAWKGFSNTILVAIAPVVELIASKLSMVLKRLAPVFQWVGRVAAEYWGVIADVLEEICTAVGEVISVIGDWIVSISGVGDTSTTIGEVVTSVLMGLGISLAYVWDLLKAGAGIMSLVAATMIDGFTIIGKAMQSLLDLGAKLPKAMGGNIFAGASRGAGEMISKMEGASESMKSWGKGAVNGIGNSAEDVRKWFGKRGKKGSGEVDADGKPVLPTEPVAIAKPAEYKGLGAALRGSKEAFSIESRFRFESQANPQLEIAKKQLAEAQRNNAGQTALIEAVKGGKTNLGVM